MSCTESNCINCKDICELDELYSEIGVRYVD